MRIGFKEIEAVSTGMVAASIMKTVFDILRCTNYPIRNSMRFELIKQFDVDEAISKYNEKINSTKPIDLRDKERRIKNRDILIWIRDGGK